MKQNLSWIKGGSRDGRPGYLLTFDYDADIISQLKGRIPASLREWDPDKKCWWVSEYCEKVVNDLFPGFLEAVVSQKNLL